LPWTVAGVLERRSTVSERELKGRYEGQVKWFSDPKGYGFILHDGGDIFVHHSAIKMDGYRTLKEGEMVVYDLFESPKGLQAGNVIPSRLSGDGNVVESVQSSNGAETA
jgi:CspA family cold shock protein